MQPYEAALAAVSEREMESFGHSSTHEPHPVHLLGSIATVSSIVIACSGQTSTHNPQSKHCSWSITAVILRYLVSSFEAVLDCRVVGAGALALVASISAILWMMALS